MHSMYNFDEEKLVAVLEDLPVPHRIAFAASCAERLMPSYCNFSNKTGRGNPQKMKEILSRLWDDLSGNSMTDVEVQSNIEACMDLIPQEDDGPWVIEQAAAEDAVSAVAYALRCRQNGKARESAWSARRSYETLDHYVVHTENIDMNDVGAELRVLAHGLVQAELMRQQRDLDYLICMKGADPRDLVKKLQAQGKRESAMFLTLAAYSDNT